MGPKGPGKISRPGFLLEPEDIRARWAVGADLWFSEILGAEWGTDCRKEKKAKPENSGQT